MSLFLSIRKLSSIFVGMLVVCTTSYAEPPDPDLLASFKNFSKPVTESYQGEICKSSVKFPGGFPVYTDSDETKSHTSRRSDGFDLLLGGKREIGLYCGKPVADIATPEAFAAQFRNGKDADIDLSSVEVRVTTLAGMPATRVDFMLTNPDKVPPGKRWHRAQIMALQKLPSGVVVQHYWTLMTTGDSLKADESTLGLLLANYRLGDGSGDASSVPKK